MISILLYLRSKPEGDVMSLYDRMCEMVSASGSEPDKPVIVGAKDSMPDGMLVEGRNRHGETVEFVDLEHYGTPVLALRAAMQKCCGLGLIACDDVEQLTKENYRRLLGAITYPVASAGASYVRDPWDLLPARKIDYGLREYTGPLAFPFSIRQEAKLKAGALPPVTTSDVDAALVAYSINLRSAGYFVAGSLSA